MGSFKYMQIVECRLLLECGLILMLMADGDYSGRRMLDLTKQVEMKRKHSGALGKIIKKTEEAIKGLIKKRSIHEVKISLSLSL